jgi:peptidoglycan hydrolase-like protein with peptidoglycan-binding domain
LRKISENKRGENVFWLQSRLKELGYYTGTVTGTYLGGTKKAVKAFQRAQGLTQTGVADVRTLELLYRDLPVATPVPTPLPTDVPETPAP